MMYAYGYILQTKKMTGGEILIIHEKFVIDMNGLWLFIQIEPCHNWAQLR